MIGVILFLKYGSPLLLTTDYEVESLYDFNFKYTKVDSSGKPLILTKASDIKGRFSDPACAVGVRSGNEYVWLLLNPRGWSRHVVYPKNGTLRISKNEFDTIKDFCKVNEDVLDYLRGVTEY